MNLAFHPPAADEYAPFYENYIRIVASGSCLEQLVAQVDDLKVLLQGLPPEEANVCHLPYTWTIKQVIGHLIDTERIFADRLHRFAAGEQQPQPGFDQNRYVDEMDYQTPSLGDLLEELAACRAANSLLVRRIPTEAWGRRGIASGHPVSVRGLLWMLVGHVAYHARIIEQRVAGKMRT